ncbi:VanZ family protein [Streptomyces sp. NPDC048473]|uniref:VanZ family protein n=1 Tax=unclassified Streptomyces TaxID=2593676 RepID=UPI0037150822
MTVEADRGRRHKAWGRILLHGLALAATFAALVAFSVVLAKVTLTPSSASEGLVRPNMHPGRSLRQYAEDYTFLAACKQVGGNVLLGVPFGVLLPILVPRRRRMVRMFFLTVLVMVLVELMQGTLVAGRAFDIDDVILNSAGALLGYLAFGRRLSHRFHTLVEGGNEPRAKAPRTRPVSKPAARGRGRRGVSSEPGPGAQSAGHRGPAAGAGRALLGRLGSGLRGTAGSFRGGAGASGRRSP